MVERKKILFQQVTDEETQSVVNETMWAIVSGEHFELDNIPFYARSISCGDIFAADYNEEDNWYHFREVITYSGNTTLRIFFFNEADFIPVQQALGDLYNCETEGFQDRNILAVNIPAAIDYTPVREYLMQGEESKRWTFEESCLLHDY